MRLPGKRLKKASCPRMLDVILTASGWGWNNAGQQWALDRGRQRNDSTLVGSALEGPSCLPSLQNGGLGARHACRKYSAICDGCSSNQPDNLSAYYCWLQSLRSHYVIQCRGYRRCARIPGSRGPFIWPRFAAVRTAASAVFIKFSTFAITATRCFHVPGVARRQKEARIRHLWQAESPPPPITFHQARLCGLAIWAAP